MEIANNSGSMIAELRKEAGYTQKSLAEALCITDKAVSKWERGLSLPDVSLLPKLSLLLNADIDFLLSSHSETEQWIGLIDLSEYPETDLSRLVYDKPLVYYMLAHYLLLGIRDIYILTTEENRKYLSASSFSDYGFSFYFDFDSLPACNALILNRPLFLFGADLTHMILGAMASHSLMKMVPFRQRETFLLCPADLVFMYKKNSGYLFDQAAERKLGRGMVSIDLSAQDGLLDAASFVRMYQRTTGLLLCDLKEIFGAETETGK